MAVSFSGSDPLNQPHDSHKPEPGQQQQQTGKGIPPEARPEGIRHQQDRPQTGHFQPPILMLAQIHASSQTPVQSVSIK